MSRVPEQLNLLRDSTRNTRTLYGTQTKTNIDFFILKLALLKIKPSSSNAYSA